MYLRDMVSADIFISLCTEAIDDKKLFDLGKHIIENINKKVGRKYNEYPDSFTKEWKHTGNSCGLSQPLSIR